MGILNYIFGSKKQKEKDSIKPVAKVESNADISQIAVVSPEESDNLRDHADKGTPVFVLPLLPFSGNSTVSPLTIK